MGEREQKAVAWGVLIALGLIGVAAACESMDALGRSMRGEIGHAWHDYGEDGGGSHYSPHVASEKGDTLYAALSFDLLPWLAGAHERERDERLAALIARANLPERPLPFEQSDPPPEPTTPGGEQPKPLDGPPGAEAGDSAPWWLSPEALTAYTAVAGLVSYWQRARLARGVESVRRRMPKRRQEPKP